MSPAPGRRRPLDALLAVAEDVHEAVEQGGAVVALESSAVVHGLPYPQNLEIAAAVTATVREAGAVPAIVGVLDGRLSVGLHSDELDRMATTPGVAKAGNRDLGVALAVSLPAPGLDGCRPEPRAAGSSRIASRHSWRRLSNRADPRVPGLALRTRSRTDGFRPTRRHR